MEALKQRLVWRVFLFLTSKMQNAFSINVWNVTKQKLQKMQN